MNRRTLVLNKYMPFLFGLLVLLGLYLTSLTRQHGGTGLGLMLTRGLTELHGGGISVESDGVPSHGSRFTVSLPWREDDGEIRGQGKKEMGSPSPQVTFSPGRPVTILLVEDNVVLV